ncbi:hypothetical protein HUW46_08493 [Amycolatopsis sp. CA-230715]|nr:hypothetical protein HUW46_08493 [Amycolatopsis sp. CA-230715]
MSEREYFAQFAKRVGMFVGRTSFRAATDFMMGYDQAARRYGEPGLTGWREWLMANYEVGANLVWAGQVMQIAKPGWQGEQDFTYEEEERLLKVLFELLDEFLAERERLAAQP